MLFYSSQRFHSLIGWCILILVCISLWRKLNKKIFGNTLRCSFLVYQLFLMELVFLLRSSAKINVNFFLWIKAHFQSFFRWDLSIHLSPKKFLKFYSKIIWEWKSCGKLLIYSILKLSSGVTPAASPTTKIISLSMLFLLKWQSARPANSTCLNNIASCNGLLCLENR